VNGTRGIYGCPSALQAVPGLASLRFDSHEQVGVGDTPII
jgi:hypothetical protein